MIERNLKHTQTIYFGAFGMEFLAIWGGTKFQAEVEDLCYKRAFTIWLQNTEDSEERRRALLYEYLKPQFAHDRATDPLNRYYNILPTNNLLVTRVINNICNLYNDAPARAFEPDTDKEVIESAYKEMKFNQIMQRASRLAKLCNEVALRPRLKKGKWIIDYITPDLYRIYYNEQGEPTEMWIPFQTMDRSGRISSRFHVWTNEFYYQLNSTGEQVKFEYNGQQYYELPNRYRVIPFLILQMSNDEIYGGGAYELVKAQLYLNKLAYITDENVTYSAVGVWLAKNILSQGESSLRLNPGTAIHKTYGLEEPEPSLEHIAGTPNYIELNEMRTIVAKSVYKEMGLPSSVIDDKSELSGIAYKIDRQELAEARKEDINILQDFEQDFLNHFINIYQTETGRQLSKEIRVNVDYNDQQIQDPKEELEYLTTLFEKGLLEPLQYVNRLTGNTLINTNEQAIEFIKQNLKYKKLLEESNGDTTDIPVSYTHLTLPTIYSV
mgnify:CR=1 FL=1